MAFCSKKNDEILVVAQTLRSLLQCSVHQNLGGMDALRRSASATMRRRVAPSAPPQARISSIERPQPTQTLSSSRVQARTHGLGTTSSITGMAAQLSDRALKSDYSEAMKSANPNQTQAAFFSRRLR